MQDRPDAHSAAWHVLRTAAWMAGCDDAVVDQLAAASRLQKYPAGALVATRGSAAEHLIVVAEGAVEVGMTNAAGKRHLVNWLGQGQLFGLIPVLEGGPMIHTATTVRPTRLLMVPRAALLQALQDHPSLSLRLIALLCRRARAQYEMLAAQSLLTLPARLMRLLLGRLEGHADGRITATQEDLADQLGVARQSLNQELRKLEREGILALGRGHIQVLDRAALARMASAGSE